jgi:hypothetical protein
MAYASNYSYLYGFSLLDDLHNFFPELMYDETLFPDPRFGWLRHRVSTLFPSVFPRQMNMYRIYNSTQRQAEFNAWISSQTIGVQTTAPPVPPQPSLREANTVSQMLRTANWDLRTQSQPRTQVVEGQSQTRSQVVEGEIAHHPVLPTIPPTITTTTTTSTQNTSGNQPTQRHTITHIIPSATVRRAAANLASDIDVLTSLLALPIQNARAAAPNPTPNLFEANDLLSLLTNNVAFQDVPVVPTFAQIDANSGIIPHDDIPADENCPICQEHVFHGDTQTAWRRLNCSHQFHNSCIMPWFQRNVYCPVCRADIREQHSPVESEDDMSIGSRSSDGGDEH